MENVSCDTTTETQLKHDICNNERIQIDHSMKQTNKKYENHLTELRQIRFELCMKLFMHHLFFKVHFGKASERILRTNTSIKREVIASVV